MLSLIPYSQLHIVRSIAFMNQMTSTVTKIRHATDVRKTHARCQRNGQKPVLIGLINATINLQARKRAPRTRYSNHKLYSLRSGNVCNAPLTKATAY